jgi:hypothetical protein
VALMSWGLGALLLGGCLAWYGAFLLRVTGEELGSAPGHSTWSLLTPLSAWVVLGTLGLGSASLVHTWGLAAVPVLLGVLLLLVPWPLAMAVAVPLGQPRLAYALARLSTVRARHDPIGLAMATAARAACRRTTHDRAAARWIAERQRTRPLTPGMVLAHGLLAEAAGQHEEARQFLAVIDLFDARVTDPTVLRWRREWVLADAARRGDWSDVVEVSQALGPTTPASEWLGAVAQRLLGRPDAPSDEALESLWRRVPGRKRTAWLHERALRAAPTAPAPTVVEEPDDPVQAALLADLALQTAPHPAALQAAADAWTRVLPTLEAQVAQRAADLGSRRPHAAVDTLHRRVAEGLQRAAERLDLPVPPVGDLTRRHAGPRRDQLLRSVELAAEALDRRLQAGRTLSAADELREWLALKALLDEVERLGGDELLRLAFRPAYGPCCTQSVHLYNEAGQPWLSNAMTRWLLHLAHRAGDQRAVALQTKNLAAVSGP